MTLIHGRNVLRAARAASKHSNIKQNNIDTKSEPFLNVGGLQIVPDLRLVECMVDTIELSLQNNKFGAGVVVSGLGAHGASDKGVVLHTLKHCVARTPCSSTRTLCLSTVMADNTVIADTSLSTPA